MAAKLTAYLVVGIVGATLIAGLIVGAQRDDSDGPIDLIIHNAKLYTANASRAMAEAVAVRGNQILLVGGSREILRLRRPQTIVLDAAGATVLPGFNDSHIHLVSGGLGLDQIDLLGATTVTEIQRRIREWATEHPERPWVLGRGWYYEPFPGGLPTRQLLDTVVPDRPAQLICYDGHTSWVNSRALELAGITARTPNPPNGVIVKDPRTGEPTGVLKESAMALVRRHAPQPTRDDRARALRAAVREAHRYGITSVQNASGSAEEFELYDEARKAGALELRVYSAISLDRELADVDFERFAAIRRRYPDDPLFKTGAVKIMLDGVIESHTAAMLEPYANRAEAGTANVSADELNRIVRRLDAAGWQIMTHAIGDRAVRMALDAYEHAVRSNPAPERGRRHRIEHVETTAAADLPRFGTLGVIGSIQPFHFSPSPNQLDVWTKNIGADRASLGWAAGSIAAGKGRLAFGSDWPVVQMNPILGLHTIVNRTTPDGRPAGGWLPSERISLLDAIDGYTSGAAWASFDEMRKGEITPGMLADLVILTDDIFSRPASALADVQVATTIFDGKVVYRRSAASN